MIAYAVTWVLVAIAATFALSLVAVLVLFAEARRGNPRVVAEAPDDAAWDQLVAAVLAARDDVDREAIDLALWDAEVGS